MTRGEAARPANGAPRGGTRPTLTYERRLWKDGHGVVAGLDEVGRGAWAGPVSVGVAVLRPRLRAPSVPRWLRDSKLLAEERREALFDEVAGWCAAWSVGHADASECDRWGMTAALRLASYRALAGLCEPPEALLVDGPYDLLRERPLPTPAAVQGELPLPTIDGGCGTVQPPPLPLPDVTPPSTIVPVVDGDAHCVAVAAASVLAKVVRDRLMRAESEHYPPYSFERNKGYPSPAHQCALRGYGLSSIHRRSWAFVDDLPWHRI